MPPSLRDAQRMARFAIVGLLNTAVGYSAILVCLSFGLGDIASNAAGYALGLCVGFVLNRDWTFEGRSRAGAIPRYVAAFLVAYGVNLTVVLAGRSFGFAENAFVHFAGICIYSVVFYLGCALFVFRAPAAGGEPAPHHQ